MHEIYDFPQLISHDNNKGAHEVCGAAGAV